MSNRRLNLPEHLVGHWPGNGHGDDVSGHGEDMTWNGSEAYRDDQFGRQALDLDGSSDYLEKTQANWRSGDTLGTVTAWIYRDVAGTLHTIWSSSDTASAIKFSVFHIRAGDHVAFQNNDGAGSNNRVRSTTTLSAGRWYHVAIVSTGTEYKIYIDGVEETLVIDAGFNNGEWLADAPDRDNVVIGALIDNTPDLHFNGGIWDTRYYNVALTQSEIASLVRMTQSIPIHTPLEQPIPQLPDLTDPALKGAWLNTKNVGGEDYSTFGNDLTPVGAPTIEKYGGGGLDGAADYYRRAEAAWRVADEAGSICAWIKLASLGGTNTIFMSGDEASDGNFLILQIDSGNKIRIIIDSDGLQAFSDTPLVANRWYFIVFTSDGSTHRLYLDGGAEGLTYQFGSNDGTWLADLANRDNVVIGAQVRSSTTAHFDGEIREVNYYSEEKNQSWITHEYRKGVPDASLVLHVTDGTKDWSRHRHPIIVGGAPVLGRRMDFDGSADYLDLGDSTAFDITAALTLMAWVKRSVSGDSQAIIIRDTGSARNYALYVDTGVSPQFQVFIGNALKAVSGDTRLRVGIWEHLAGVFNGVDVRLYLNGVLDSTPVAAPGAIDNDDASLFVGARGAVIPDRFFKGVADDVKVFADVAKSAAFLKAHVERTRVFY